MSDLMAFLRARLDEDEAAAKAAVTGEIPQQWRFTERWQYEDAKRLYANRERALREVAFKRAILAEYEEALQSDRVLPDGVRDSRDPWEVERDVAILDALEGVVRHLTAIWRDHADYREITYPEIT